MISETHRSLAEVVAGDTAMPSEIDFVILEGLRDKIIKGVKDRGTLLETERDVSYHLEDGQKNVRLSSKDNVGIALRLDTEIQGQYLHLDYRDEIGSWRIVVIEKGQGVCGKQEILEDTGYITETSLSLGEINVINISLASVSKALLKAEKS